MEKISEKIGRKQRVTVTVDYSCLDAGGEREDMIRLKEFTEEGVIEMMATEQMEKEFYENSPPDVQVKLTKQFQAFSKLSPDDPAVWGRMRWGHFRYGGGGTTRDGKDVFDYAKQIRPLMFPNFESLSDSHQKSALDDVMHLSIHYVYGRDIFLTRNVKHFKTEALTKSYPDIVVLEPQDLVDLLNRSKRNPQIQ